MCINGRCGKSGFIGHVLYERRNPCYILPEVKIQCVMDVTSRWFCQDSNVWIQASYSVY